jgi:hypothetical protein
MGNLRFTLLGPPEVRHADQMLLFSTRMAEYRILEKDVGPSPPPSTSPFRYPSSVRPSLSGSVRVVKPISPTG